jgi:virginiamycin B lyase
MKYNFASFVLVLFLAFISQSVLESSAQEITVEDLVKYAKSSNFIKEFEIPLEERGLKGITADSDGNVWFYHSTNSTSKIIKMEQSGELKEYNVMGDTVVPSYVVQLAGGQLILDEARNALWFTDARTNSIGRLDTESGQIHLIFIPTERAGPMGITLSNDKKTIWFTEILASKIAKLDPTTDKITEYSTGGDTGPTLLIFDKNNVLWVTQSYSHNVLRIQPDLLDSVLINGMQSLSLQKPDTFSPFGLAIVDSQQKQKIIISDHGSSRIVLSDVDSNLSEFTSYWTSPSSVYPQTLPGQVVSDKTGNVYFPQHGGNKISKIDTDSGVMTEYEVPTGPLATIVFAAITPDGSKVWFTEWASNKIGYLDTTIPVPYDLNVSNNKITLDKSGPKTIIAELKSESDAQYVSTNDVEIGVIGMTDSGLSGVSYEAASPRTNLAGDKNVSTEIALTVQDGANPGTFSIMARASALEKDSLVISLLYPILVTLDVPEQPSNEGIVLKPQTTKQDESSDSTIYLALFAAGGLIAFMMYRRIKKSKSEKGVRKI